MKNNDCFIHSIDGDLKKMEMISQVLNSTSVEIILSTNDDYTSGNSAPASLFLKIKK